MPVTNRPSTIPSSARQPIADTHKRRAANATPTPARGTPSEPFVTSGLYYSSMRRLAVILALLAGSARATEPPPSPLAEAQEKLRLAGRERDPAKRDKLVADVIATARKLAAALPKDPEPRFVLGRALSVAD